jgi:hypothetical protein
MNYNAFFKTLKETPKKAVRDQMTEYHYLVVNKETGKILLKPILDIHTFKTNPCNDLQINWRSEFKHADHVTPSLNFNAKIQELLKVIQTSVRRLIASMKDFADADFEVEFPIE